MNCPKCGLLIGHGTMGTILPLCQCGWQQVAPLNSLDNMGDYDRLAEELAATKQKLVNTEYQLQKATEAYDSHVSANAKLRLKVEALEAERKELEKQEPEAWIVLLSGEYSHIRDTNPALFEDAEEDGQSEISYVPLYARPLPAPDLQKRVDELEEQLDSTELCDKLMAAWIHEHGQQMPWGKAVELIATVMKMPTEERDRLLCLYYPDLLAENAELTKKLAEETEALKALAESTAELQDMARAAGIEEGEKMACVAEQNSRYMFVARLQNLRDNKDPTICINDVLALIDDCDMLALAAPTHKEE